MSLLPELEALPFHRVCVALDLETTGLDRDRDEIIEVGAVRFQGRKVLDTFSVLVNPHRNLSPFIQRLTGISQADVDGAPSFGEVSSQLQTFIGDAPLVGHNVAFDLAFLARRGLRFTAPAFDTWDLAAMLLPGAERSLASLAATFKVPHPQAHRALNDAEVTHQVLMALSEVALKVDPAILAEMSRLATVARWPLRHLLEGLEAEAGRRPGHRPSTLGPGGVDMEGLQNRLQPGRRRSAPVHGAVPLEEERLVSFLQDGGPLASTLPGYEHRTEQEAMLRAVTQAFQEGHHLLVEAGTGVGKSISYLLPAALFALRNNSRVLISTNTINLQEQLVSKDIPAVVATMEKAGEARADELRFTTLKGRANYLCLRRWTRLRSAESLNIDEARLLGKLLMWLPETSTGDQAELHLAGQENGIWGHLSAQGSLECPDARGPCCLLSARNRADSAHLVVVNHALLLADLQQGGGLLPPFDHLIIDEAHHLEEEATRQFGFRVGFSGMDEALNALMGPRGLAAATVDAYRGSKAAAARRQGTQEAVLNLTEALAHARGKVKELFEGLTGFLQNHGEFGEGLPKKLLVSTATRAQVDWSALEIAGENVDISLREVVRRLDALHGSLNGLERADLTNYAELRGELFSQADAFEQNRGKLNQFFLQPQAEAIYWVEGGEAAGVVLCAAPLHVGTLLQGRLFDRKESVVLTSATLSTAGSFAPIRERLGLEEAEELLLGSPFDYPRAALVCLPQDMPEPAAKGYSEALAAAVAGLARAAGGRAMVLFTSHASLRAARKLLTGLLEEENLRVLAQGVDGTPKHILEEFLKDPRAILLGTASFWEGVDLAGEALQVLVLARLPFDVPTEPIFAARSQLYEEPFREYTIPQAVLRFRQGFGRLIRTQRDRGVVVVLDRRITSRSYGEIFLRSLPECTVARLSLAELPGAVAQWLAK